MLRKQMIKIYCRISLIFERHVYRKIISKRFEKKYGNLYGQEIDYIKKIKRLTVFPYQLNSYVLDDIQTGYDDKVGLHYAVLSN